MISEQGRTLPGTPGGSEVDAPATIFEASVSPSQWLWDKSM